MPKLNFLTPSLALIIVAMGFFIAWQCESGKRKDLERYNDNRLNEIQIENLQAVAKTAIARRQELERERVKLLDSVRVAITSKKQAIKAHEDTTEKLRPEVAARIDSVPVLKAFVGSLQSTIAKQKELIQGLELAHSAEIVNLESQLRESARQNVKQVEISESWSLAAEDAQKDVRKANRKKGFWRTTTAILAGGVIFLSLQQ